MHTCGHAPVSFRRVCACLRSPAAIIMFIDYYGPGMRAIMAYLHDLLVVELPLLGQLIHILEEHRSQAVIAHSCARWVFDCISKRSNNVHYVRGGAVSSHEESCTVLGRFWSTTLTRRSATVPARRWRGTGFVPKHARAQARPKCHCLRTKP
jgi:hypothetical protein